MSVHVGGRGPGHLARSAAAFYPAATAALDFQLQQYRIGSGFWSVRDTSLLTGLTYSGSVSGTGATVRYATTSGGVLVPFANGVLRVVDQGWLDEAAATNLALQSQTLNSWNTTNATVTADQIIAPDGTLTADLVTVTSATGNHSVVQPSAITVTNATAYTQSFYAKAGTSTHVGTDFKSVDSTQGRATFVLSGAGTATANSGTSASATILALANGWYYCTLTATVSSTSQSPSLNVLNSSGTFSYTGAGESAYFWGDDFKLGSAVSSYIPTTTAAVTRSADALTLTYSGSPTTATVSYGAASTATPSSTSPLDLGSSSGGAWVGNYVTRVIVQ